MKRVFIIHGWSGKPEHGWYPWLKKELEKKGFKASVPKLPNTDDPKIDAWVSTLSSAVGNSDEDTYFVGHSMGCQTIARYLEKLSDNEKVGGAVFVGGYFKSLTGLVEDEPAIWKKWKGIPVNLDEVRAHLLKSVAIFSDNDPYVPLENSDDFKNKLGSEIIILKNMGHFIQNDGCYEVPIVLEKLLEIANSPKV